VIVVCGEALIDMIQNGDGTQRAAPGGGPFNTARALARLDVPTAFVGHLSTDAFGRELAGLLEVDGVTLRFVSEGPEPTTIAVADVDSNGLAEYQFLIQGTSAPNLTTDMIPDQFDADITALHLGTLGFVLEPMADTLVKLVERESGKRLVMVDPNVRLGLGDDEQYRERLHHVMRQSTVVKASDADLAWAYRGLDYEQAAARILDDGVRVVVVTLGAEGAFAAHRDFRVRVPAPQVQVVDTIGAGDAFGAALLAWLHDHDCLRPDPELDEAHLKSALDFACLAASITCTRKGADPPHKWEMPRV
jgi:fructokinase